VRKDRFNGETTMSITRILLLGILLTIVNTVFAREYEARYFTRSCKGSLNGNPAKLKFAYLETNSEGDTFTLDHVAFNGVTYIVNKTMTFSQYLKGMKIESDVSQLEFSFQSSGGKKLGMVLFVAPKAGSEGDTFRGVCD
jgi:hypothetical protein